jgi:hypothetical protein
MQQTEALENLEQASDDLRSRSESTLRALGDVQDRIERAPRYQGTGGGAGAKGDLAQVKKAYTNFEDLINEEPEEDNEGDQPTSAPEAEDQESEETTLAKAEENKSRQDEPLSCGDGSNKAGRIQELTAELETLEKKKAVAAEQMRIYCEGKTTRQEIYSEGVSAATSAQWGAAGEVFCGAIDTFMDVAAAATGDKGKVINSAYKNIRDFTQDIDEMRSRTVPVGKNDTAFQMKTSGKALDHVANGGGDIKNYIDAKRTGDKTALKRPKTGVVGFAIATGKTSQGMGELYEGKIGEGTVKLVDGAISAGDALGGESPASGPLKKGKAVVKTAVKIKSAGENLQKGEYMQAMKDGGGATVAMGEIIWEEDTKGRVSLFIDVAKDVAKMGKGVTDYGAASELKGELQGQAQSVQARDDAQIEEAQRKITEYDQRIEQIRKELTCLGSTDESAGPIILPPS